MGEFTKKIFLTLVLTLPLLFLPFIKAVAAETTKISPKDLQTQSADFQKNDLKGDERRTESPLIDQASLTTGIDPNHLNLSQEEQARLFSLEKERWGNNHLGVHLVSRIGQFLRKEDFSSYLGVAFQFNHDFDYNQGLDVCFEILNSTVFALQVAERNYFINYERLYLPYWKWGLGSAYVSDEGIGTFFDLKRIQATIGMGLADLSNSNREFYFETGLGFALIGTQFYFSLGYSRNF